MAGRTRSDNRWLSVDHFTYSTRQIHNCCGSRIRANQSSTGDSLGTPYLWVGWTCYPGMAPHAYILGLGSDSDDLSKEYGSLILIVSRRGT